MTRSFTKLNVNYYQGNKSELLCGVVPAPRMRGKPTQIKVGETLKVNHVYNMDWIEAMKLLPDKCVKTCVTSPPYWGLRDYGVAGQLGLESTPEEYVSKIVTGFREFRRILRDDGTLWLNLGDSYAGSCKGFADDPKRKSFSNRNYGKLPGYYPVPENLKPKDLVGIPWRVALALQADGWYLRSDIIWSKPNPMPESVTDRPTKAHEYIFLLSKSEKYYYNASAIREKRTSWEDARGFRGGSYVEGKPGRRSAVGNKLIKIPGGWETKKGSHGTIHREGRTSAEYREIEVSEGRNKRTVWTVATRPFPEAHFATFPPELIKPCILAGCPEAGTVYDPFMGAYTTAVTAFELRRNYLGSELNPDYIAIGEKRVNEARQRREALGMELFA